MSLRVLYIAGCTHSGSTLMNRVLGAHPRAVTLGSVKKLPAIIKRKTPCCCGAAALVECPFWGAVDRELRADGKSLESLDVQSRSNERFIEDNRAFYAAVQRASGAELIIESSRRSSRLKRLRGIAELELIPVHLYKTPAGQAGSWKRKRKGRVQWIPDYLERNVRILAECRNHPAAVMLSYEEFCLQPERELRRVLGAAGLEHDARVLEQWGSEPIHTLGGNRMKQNTSSEIVLDESWRERLSAWEVRIMQWVCGPVWRRMEARRLSGG